MASSGLISKWQTLKTREPRPGHATPSVHRQVSVSIVLKKVIYDVMHIGKTILDGYW